MSFHWLGHLPGLTDGNRATYILREFTNAGNHALFRLALFAFLISVSAPMLASAQQKEFTLSSPQALSDSGFLRFLVPRYSLKTGVRINVQISGQTGADGAEARFTTYAGGRLVMQGLGQRFSLVLPAGTSKRHDHAQRFADWLFSEIGKRTIIQFAPDGDPVFSLVAAVSAQQDAPDFDGDIVMGEALSFTNCGRCHVIGKRNRMQGIGSTPSFGVLRSLANWQERFATFYQRRPHPAITQIEDLTAPFDPARPPSAYPLYLSVDDFNNILAYVSTVAPADLGAPLVEHQ